MSLYEIQLLATARIYDNAIRAAEQRTLRSCLPLFPGAVCTK
jgi:hypothetical protein